MSEPAMETAPAEERLFTVAEYAALPEDDEWRDELVRGRIVREPQPGYRHGRTQARLVVRLGTFVEEHGLGAVVTETGVALPGLPATVRGPDVAFWAAGREPEPSGRPFPESAPDLVVEIVSPSNRVGELIEKVREYLGAGTRMVWVVDPGSRTATVYRSREDIRLLTEDEPLEGGDVVPGFEVPLRDVLP